MVHCTKFRLQAGVRVTIITVMSAHVIILEAIATRKCVRATYNRVAMKLAPHILYTRHGEMHVDAVALERDGQPPKERKLGTFKLTGLNDIALSDNPFAIEDLFQPSAEKYAGVTLFAVEAQPNR